MGHREELYHPSQEYPEDVGEILALAIENPGILEEPDREMLAEASASLQHQIKAAAHRPVHFGPRAAAELMWKLGQFLNHRERQEA